MKKSNGRTFLMSSELSVMAGFDTTPGIDVHNNMPNQKCHELLLGRKDACPDCPVIKSLRDGKLHQGVIQLPSGRTLVSRCYPLKNAENEVQMLVYQTSEFYLKTSVKCGVTPELFAPLPLGYWEEDLVSGAFYCSDAIIDLIGYSRDDFHQTDGFSVIADFIHPEDHPRYEKHILAALENRKPHDFIFRGIRKNGEIRYVRDMGVVVCTADGEPIRAFGTLTDVTDQILPTMKGTEYVSYRELFAEIETPIAILALSKSSPGQFEFLEINPLFKNVFHTHGKTTTTLTLETVFPNSGARLGVELVKAVFDKSKFPVFHLKEDGRVFEVRPQFLRNQIMTIVFTEITDYYNKAQYLVESDRRWKYAADSSREGVWDWDLQSNDIYWSPGFFKVLGYEESELVPSVTVWNQLMNPDDLVKQNLYISRYLNREIEEYEEEFRMGCKNGEWKWFLSRGKICEYTEDGAPQRFLGTIIEINTRKKSEFALIESERRLTEAQNLAHVGNWEYDIKQKLYLGSAEANRIYKDSDGPLIMTREEFVCIVHEEDRPTVFEKMKASKSKRVSDFELKYRIITPAGKHKFILCIIQYEFDADGRVIHKFGASQDITSWRKTELALENSREKLAQSQKMEAIGRMAGSIAHDFNNILQTVMGFGKLAQDTLPKNSEAAEYLVEIQQASKKAGTLVRQILAFSRKGKQQCRVLPLKTILTGMVSIIKQSIGNHIELKIDDYLSPVLVNVDSGQIEQVLLNLCVNARDAMPNGGQLFIGIKNVKTPPQEWAPKSVAGKYAVLEVTDTGKGISSEHLAHVFEPFFTTKTSGTGLGLATTYNLVKQHKGFIEVESEPGSGTRFQVYLPAETIQTGQVLVIPEKKKASGILLAEDDSLVRKFTTRILEKANYTVFQASDGDDALTVYGAHADEIQMLVLDVMMPGMTGPDVYSSIHKSRSDIPVLFCSGYGTDFFKEDFKGVYEAKLLRKPFLPDQLLLEVDNLLSQKCKSLPLN